MKKDNVQIGFHVRSCIMSFRCFNNGSEGEGGGVNHGDNHTRNIPQKLRPAHKQTTILATHSTIRTFPQNPTLG